MENSGRPFFSDAQFNGRGVFTTEFSIQLRNVDGQVVRIDDHKILPEENYENAAAFDIHGPHCGTGFGTVECERKGKLVRTTFFLVVMAFFSLATTAQTRNDNPVLPGFPQSFQWRNSPADWNVKNGVLTIKSAEKADWYISPTDGQKAANSPIMLFPAPKDFWFSAKVTVDFKSQFDAGVLAIYADEKDWVKFAFENSANKTPSIVSVVTRGISDDCTGAAIEGNSVYLKVSKTGQAIFLYFSTDGQKWKLTRALDLGPEQPLQFGFSAQSPSGNGSTVTFSDIHYKPEALKFWTGN